MKPGWANPGYEVIVIQVGRGHPKGENADKLVESYPGNNSWGKTGFTHTKEEDARKAAMNLYHEKLRKKVSKKTTRINSGDLPMKQGEIFEANTG